MMTIICKYPICSVYVSTIKSSATSLPAITAPIVQPFIAIIPPFIALPIIALILIVILPFIVLILIDALVVALILIIPFTLIALTLTLIASTPIVTLAEVLVALVALVILVVVVIFRIIIRIIGPLLKCVVVLVALVPMVRVIFAVLSIVIDVPVGILTVVVINVPLSSRTIDIVRLLFPFHSDLIAMVRAKIVSWIILYHPVGLERFLAVVAGEVLSIAIVFLLSELISLSTILIKVILPRECVSGSIFSVCIAWGLRFAVVGLIIPPSKVVVVVRRLLLVAPVLSIVWIERALPSLVTVLPAVVVEAVCGFAISVVVKLGRSFTIVLGCRIMKAEVVVLHLRLKVILIWPFSEILRLLVKLIRILAVRLVDVAIVVVVSAVAELPVVLIEGRIRRDVVLFRVYIIVITTPGATDSILKGLAVNVCLSITACVNRVGRSVAIRRGAIIRTMCGLMSFTWRIRLLL